MKKLVFLFILLSCQDNNMTISEASEIHFWRAGTNSFNIDQPGYTEKRCFSQKFLCTGTRKLQVLGGADESDELTLSILEDGVEVASLPFTQTDDSTPGTPEVPESEVGITLPDLDEGYNVSGDETDWTLGVNPSLVLSGLAPNSVQSNPWVLDYDFIEGKVYKITPNIDYDMSGSSFFGSIRFVVLDNFNEIVHSENFILNTLGLPNVFTTEIFFLAGENFKKFGFIPLVDGVAGAIGLTADINSLAGTEITPATPAVPGDPATLYLNTISFNPYDLGLCDKTLSFEIKDEANEVLFYSDPVDFVTTWANGVGSGRIILNFKSVQNYAGLIYSSESAYFTIELDGQFRKEKLVTAQKAIELSTKTLNTAATIKTQKLLFLNDLTDYMHKKVCLVLAHAASGSVLVNGEEITVEESYDVEETPENVPLAPSQIYLTLKNSYSQNVI